MSKVVRPVVSVKIDVGTILVVVAVAIDVKLIASSPILDRIEHLKAVILVELESR